MTSQARTDDPDVILIGAGIMSATLAVLLNRPENRDLLRRRFEALSAHPLYHGMEYPDDKQQIAEWIPLVMEGHYAAHM